MRLPELVGRRRAHPWPYPYTQHHFFVFFLSNRPVHNVPWAAVGQVQRKYRFWQCQGVHTGFSSRLGPHGFPLRWLWSCQWDFPLVWISVRFVSFW